MVAGCVEINTVYNNKIAKTTGKQTNEAASNSNRVFHSPTQFKATECKSSRREEKNRGSRLEYPSPVQFSFQQGDDESSCAQTAEGAVFKNDQGDVIGKKILKGFMTFPA